MRSNSKVNCLHEEWRGTLFRPIQIDSEDVLKEKQSYRRVVGGAACLHGEKLRGSGQSRAGIAGELDTLWRLLGVVGLNISRFIIELSYSLILC